MSWIAKLDARASKWPTPARAGYLVVKWSLVAIGAGALTYSWAQRMGWQTAAWFLLAPLVAGIVAFFTEPPASR